MILYTTFIISFNLLNSNENDIAFKCTLDADSYYSKSCRCKKASINSITQHEYHITPSNEFSDFEMTCGFTEDNDFGQLLDFKRAV